MPSVEKTLSAKAKSVANQGSNVKSTNIDRASALKGATPLPNHIAKITVAAIKPARKTLGSKPTTRT